MPGKVPPPVPAPKPPPHPRSPQSQERSRIAASGELEVVPVVSLFNQRHDLSASGTRLRKDGPPHGAS